ncbi:MAG: hypothetical protein KA761_01155 [Gemmatimonadaceae bacterium]|nr:hypothetical protein [Gemmatimonadaceae bacterium]
MTTFPNHLARRLRRGLLVSTLAVLAGAVACDDPFKITAQYPNVDVTFELWALDGAPASYPTAVLVPQATAVRLDAAGSFDLAFDIDASGRVTVLPVGTVVSPISGTRVVEFQRGTGTYNTIVEAPKAGWQADSTLTVNEGQSFLVKVNTLYCQYDLQQVVYAKFVVDSVIPAERRMKISARINPNCGFRSFLSGVPEF